MNFHKHSDLIEQHAFLGASRYHWINYDEEKLKASYRSYMATLKGTELHEFAATCIRLKQRLPNSKKTLNMYVNDAIGYRMTPEQPLVYSSNCFGTADAISYRKKFLRIHDFKSGVVPAHMEQLLIYAGLFCLEYKINPKDIQIELRIYQNDKIFAERPEENRVVAIMNIIKRSDAVITKLIESEEGYEFNSN